MMKLSAHTLLLPTRGQLEARMMVTAFEMGLDNVTEDAVSTVVCALEVRVCVFSVTPTFWYMFGGKDLNFCLPFM